MNWQKYSAVLKNKEYIFTDAWGEPSIKKCSHLAVATGAHIIACVDFYGHTYGYTPEVYALMERLKTFYKL